MPNPYPGPLPDDPEDEDYLPVRPANAMANLDSTSGVPPVNTGAPLIRAGGAASPQPPAMPSDYPPVSIPRGPSGPDFNSDVMSGSVAPPVYNEPKVSTGRSVGGGLLSLISPQLGQRVMEAPVERAQREYGAEKNQYDTAINQGKAQSEEALQGAQTTEANARADALKNPPAKQAAPEKIGQTVETGEGVFQWNPDSNRYDIKVGPPKKAATEGKPDTIEMGDSTYQWDPDAKKWNKIGAAKKAESAEGTWSLEETADGKPILYNSKTAQTRPADGIQKSGTKAKADAATEKETAPVQAAQQYAEDYLDNGTFTGPGDEALQEKFFELAKPSTGFRMSQPQIDMLQKSRSWMGSAEAHLRHLTTGTWFSDDQRKQIVDTMKQLGSAKMKAVSGGGSKEGGKLTVDEAREYLKKAGGDKDKARKMAKDDGRNF
jgi:hypothetical protein